jgi:hypothetical protein
LSRSSLNPGFPEIIPAWLMGHLAPLRWPGGPAAREIHLPGVKRPPVDTVRSRPVARAQALALGSAKAPNRFPLVLDLSSD